MSKKKKTDVVVCEFHQEVIQYIHRAIARKRLPFNGLTMLHFDSHPDLAFPKHLLANDCYDKEKMYNDLDIADWILPLVYMGHISSLLWIRPYWAKQIDDLLTNVSVGKEKSAGKLRITCTEDYFLEDGIFAPLDNIDNVQSLCLGVSELIPLIRQVKERYKLHRNTTTEGLPRKRKLTDDNHIEETNSSKDHIKDMLPSENESYILDIDLDYYSVKNPFLDDFTPEEYDMLKKIYRTDLPFNKNISTIMKSMEAAQDKLEGLRKTIHNFSNGITDETNTEFQEFLKNLKSRKSDCDLQMASLNVTFSRKRTSQDVDVKNQVHDAGQTTELPHHISTDDEIDKMIKETEEFLRRLPPPSLITIARKKELHKALTSKIRSTEDEYCPPEQIESIQEKVITMLQRVYADLNIIYDYKDTSRLI